MDWCRVPVKPAQMIVQGIEIFTDFLVQIYGDLPDRMQQSGCYERFLIIPHDNHILRSGIIMRNDLF